MNFDKLVVAPEVILSILAALSEHYRIQEPLEGIYRVSGGGANDANHLLVRTQSSRQFGIKTQNRGGGAEGERREEAFSKACTAVGFVHACRAVRVESIPHLSGFDKTPSVITEWAPDSKRVDEVTETDKQVANLPDVLLQIGQWIAADLHLGLIDRAGLKNWVWSVVHQRITTVDTESAFQTATVQDHHPLIDKFYGRAKLKQERGQSDAAIAFENGLRQVHEQFVAHPEAIAQAVAAIASARNYSSPFAGLNSVQLVDKVYSEL